MDTEERVLGRDKVDVAEFPSSNSPSWRGWLLKFLSTAEQLHWNYETCCQMMSESLRRAVFNAFLEANISVEVEFGDPSVIDVLSRTSEVICVSQIELIEERFLLKLRQEKEENIADYARRVGAFKTLALETFSDEHWASNCLSGLNDECLRDVVRNHAQITLIVRELERQDCLEQQLNGLWAKIGLPKVSEVFRNLRSCRRRSGREALLTWTVPMLPNVRTKKRNQKALRTQTLHV